MRGYELVLRGNKEDAESDVRAFNMLPIHEFCPIINDTCKAKICMCWRDSYVYTATYSDNTVSFYATEPKCINPLIDGVIQVEKI